MSRTTSCSRQRGRMPQAVCLMSGGWERCSRASRVESCIKTLSASRRWRSRNDGDRQGSGGGRGQRDVAIGGGGRPDRRSDWQGMTMTGAGRTDQGGRNRQSLASARSATSAACFTFPNSTCLQCPTFIWRRAQSYARRGSFVPPYDTAATLVRLAAGISRTMTRRW